MLRIDLVSPYVLLWTVFPLLLIISKDNKEHILGRKRRGGLGGEGEIEAKLDRSEESVESQRIQSRK